MRKFLLLILFLSGVYASEYNLTLVYNDNIKGNYKFIGNTVLEPNKDINYSAIYLEGNDNRVIIYDNGKNIIAKDKYNNICIFPRRDSNGNIVDISKQQKKYKFNDSNYIEFNDDEYKTVTVNCSSNEFSVNKKKKKAQWTKFKNGCLEGHTYNNNFCYSKYIDIDNNSSTFDSSSSDLTLPNGSKIVYAGLYWSGLIDKNEKKLDKAKHVLLKINDGNYIPLYTNNNNSKNDNNDSFYYTTQASGYVYTAFKNITDKFKEYNDTLKKITVANVMSEKGINVNIGNFGAWALVVVYKNSKGHLKNIVIYNSFLKFYKNNKIIHVKDILTPINGKVYSKLSYFTVEGDIKSPEYREKANKDFTDKVEIKTNKTDDYINVSPNENNVSAPNYYLDIMDSSITTKENRTPEIENNMGIDIDTFDVGKDGNNSHKQILDNNITSVDIKITTGKDTFFLNSVVFATDLYQPRVCYYLDKIIESDNNQTVFENGKFRKKQLDTSKKYIFKYKLSNKDKNKTVDTVEKVQVFLKYNNFDYEKNSTYLSKYNSDVFEFITDKKGDDRGEFLENKNMSVWRIGKDANSTDGGELKQNDYNFAKITGQFNETNDTYIDLDKIFHFTASFKTASGGMKFSNYSIPKCENYETKVKVKQDTLGSFDVVNKNFTGNKDPLTKDPLNELYTQVVNKQYETLLLNLNEDNISVVEPYTGVIKVDLVNMKDKKVIFTDWVFMLNSDRAPLINYVNSSYKNVRYKVTFLENENGEKLNMSQCFSDDKKYFKWKECSKLMNSFPGVDAAKCETEAGLNHAGDTIGEIFNGDIFKLDKTTRKYVVKYMQCVFDQFPYIDYVYSRDNFAIRPYKFVFDTNNLPKKLKAGKEYDLIIKAVDINGSVVNNYNELVNVNSSTNSPTLNTLINTKKCQKGDLILTKGVRFNNGKASVTFKYSEVGDVNFTIKENNGSEYAVIDSSDSKSPNGIKIKDNGIKLTFVPDHFKLMANFSNYNGGDFTYMSNDLNMSAPLEINITAENYDNNITKNYDQNCYAKNINIDVSYDIDKDEKLIIDTINGTKVNITNGKISFNNVNKSIFNNGKAKVKILINTPREYNKTKKPFNLMIKSVVVSDEDNVSGNKDLNKTANFRYGFLKVKNLTAYDTKDINTTFEYYYFSNNGWIINKEHNSSNFGDIYISKIKKPNDISLSINQKNGKNINEGQESVNISTTHSIPYSAKIHLSIPSWLWYHPLAKPYKDPSNSNEDCLTHPCIKVTFLKSGSGWAGIGRENSIYNEKNKTVEVNLSKEINGTKKEVKKLNW